MDYQQTIDYLYSQLPMFQRQGASAYKENLDNTVKLMNILGHPYKNFKSIHVAGTNGKGSVSHCLASIFQEAGYKTGLYTSPHLIDFRERIRINGKMIPEKKVVEFVKKYSDGVKSIKPSFFEMTVGMAFDYFSDEEIDIAIVEVGLGGRLDSTNIITPELSLITNIGMDHTQFLGDSLQKIATEKAGIIKHNIPVVIGQTQDEVKNIFTDFARTKKTSVTFADQEMQKTGFRTLTGWKPSTKYQLKNLITVLTSIRILQNKSYNIHENNIVNGIKKVKENTGLIGRWQKLSDDPLTICDVGHNEDGLKEVVSEIEKTDFNKLHFVFGTVSDKSPNRIFDILPKYARYYFCKADIPRGMPVKNLMEASSRLKLNAMAYPSVKEAYKAAVFNAKNNDLVFIGGSTFIVAECLQK